MKSKPQTVSENGLTNIPTELFIEILLRLPSKSIAICRCVSKLWTSILESSDFTEVFLTKSLARPQLLFTCKNKDGELLFFTTSQAHNPNANSFPLAASYQAKIPTNFNHETVSPIRGLVFVRDELNLNGRRGICNASTGQFLTLPKVRTTESCIRSYFGYDPIEKQFKVLSMTPGSRGLSQEHQVLTLETGELSWRKVECCIPHYPLYKGICINGVLYYAAKINVYSPVSMIICFDVRSEKFRSIKVMESRLYSVLLINYNGKLGALTAGGYTYVSGITNSFRMWVLQDAEKEEWSKHRYELPSSLRETFGDKGLWLCGVTRKNEIVFSSNYHNETGSFYIFFYNMEKCTAVRVEIQGMEACTGNRIDIYLDHVEDVRLMQKVLNKNFLRFL